MNRWFATNNENQGRTSYFQSRQRGLVKGVRNLFSLEGTTPEAPSPHNGASLLARIHVEGQRQSEPSEYLPPIDFKYGPFEPETRNFDLVTGHFPPGRAVLPMKRHS